MVTRMIIAAVIVIALSMALSAWAAPPASQPDGGTLDDLIRQAEQAIEKRPDPVKPDDKPAGSGEPTTAAGDEEEDDEDPMVTALLKKAGGGNSKPPMLRITEGMGVSRSLLREEYEVGQRTQRVQAEIIKDLDDAIAAAQQAQSSSSSSSSQSKGDKQQQGQQQGQQPGQGQPQTNQGQSPAGDSRASHGSVQHGEKNPEIKEGRAEWGGLPERDRDQIVQGRSEEMVPRWRAIIEKYYTALQVQSEKKD